MIGAPVRLSILLAGLFFFNLTSLFPDNDLWISHHKEAIKYLECDSSKAYHHYNEAIRYLDDKTKRDTLFLYLERGDLSFKYNRIHAAIRDYDHILFTLVPSDVELIFGARQLPVEYMRLFCDALYGRLQCFARRGEMHKCMDEFEALKQLDSRYPVVEEMEDGTLIFRNFTQDPEEIKLFTDMMLESQLIEKASDIQASPSGVVIMTPTESCTANEKPCCDSCGNGDHCEDDKAGLIEKGKKKKDKDCEQKQSQTRISRCEENCESVASAALLCVEGSKKVKVVSFGAIEAAKRFCIKCCQGGGFYENCVKPLLKYCQAPQDPAFNDRWDDRLNENWNQHYRDNQNYWDDIYNHRHR